MPTYISKPPTGTRWRGRVVRRPVAFFAFHGGGNDGRDEIQGLDGAAVNGPTSSVGPYGRQRTFAKASDQYYDLGNPPPLQLTGNITLAASYRLASLPTSNAGYQLIAKDNNSGGRAYNLDVNNASITGVRFFFNGGGTVTSGTANEVREGRTPVVGDDRIAVGRYTQARGLIQLDILDMVAGTYFGKSVAATTSGIPAATANVYLGRRQYPSPFTDPLDGDLRLAAIWDAALSDHEVRAFLADPFAELRPRRLALLATAALAGGGGGGAVRKVPIGLFTGRSY